MNLKIKNLMDNIFISLYQELLQNANENIKEDLNWL